MTNRQSARAFRAWMRTQLDADEAGSDWPHRPSCQMMSSVPEGFPFKGFSCNCNAPARWLAEIEVKRRRLARHHPIPASDVDWVSCRQCHASLSLEKPPSWPCPDLRDDAAAYADRDGYREEWRPT